MEYEKRIKNADDAERQILEATRRNKQSILDETLSTLKQMTSDTNENSSDVIEAWTKLANTSVGQYQAALLSLPETTRNTVTEMTGVAYNYTAAIATAWANMAAESESEFTSKISNLPENMQNQLLSLVKIINSNGGTITQEVEVLANNIIFYFE